jgi:ABC-type sugar transport system ATPase subunit
MGVLRPALEARDVQKRFPGVRALKGVDVSVYSGEVHCWIGENGAGKSTLIKILGGAYSIDSGEVLIEGKPLIFRNPHEAQSAGLSFIFQELSVINSLSVADNILLGNEIRRGPLLARRSTILRAGLLLDRIGFSHIDPTLRVGFLSTAEKQAVMIARALHLDSRVIFMDEPTASLDRPEVARLFEVIATVKAEGRAIVFVSHRMNEISEIADRVTVFKDGAVVAIHSRGEFTQSQLVNEMVGREMSSTFPAKSRELGSVILSAQGISTSSVKDVSFDLRRGEVIGIAGLVGAGRTELLNALFGIDPIQSGSLTLEGRRLTLKNCRDAIDAGFAMVPEDRRGQGIIARRSVEENLTLAWAGRIDRSLRWKSRGRKLARSFVERLRVKTFGLDQLIGNLSGGNQQKVVVARWLAIKPKVLLLDEPTKGVDVGAKSELFWIMDELVREGVSIVMVSSELTEILGMADRVLVMHEGFLVAELPGDTTEQEIMQAALVRAGEVA